jgi:hypothetical protein
MSCKYCAQDERLDGFGYCQKYNCFERSGEKSILDNLISDAKKLWFTEDQWMSVSGPVSNSYSKNHRVADSIKDKATYRFGFVPFELTDAIPFKFRDKKWDRNIRW